MQSITRALCVPGEGAIATAVGVAVGLGLIEQSHGRCQECAILCGLKQPDSCPGKLIMESSGRVQLGMCFQTCTVESLTDTGSCMNLYMHASGI